jgi:hypothetical protein
MFISKGHVHLYALTDKAPLKRLYNSLCWLVGPSVGWLVHPLVGWSMCPHDEILQNLLTLKTGYVAIALRLGFGNNLVFLD